jgi:hypothetical protein
MKFRKRPIVIEAVQFFPEEIFKFDDIPDGAIFNIGEEAWYCETLEGDVLLKGGEWIVTGLKGEHYPVQDEIFQLSHLPVMEGEEAERVREEIIFAHDLIKTLLAGGVPGKNPDMQQAEVWQASLNALCWVLGHDFGRVLQRNIEQIHGAIKKSGGSFEPGPGHPPKEGPTAFSLN